MKASIKLGAFLIVGSLMLSACSEATIEKVEPASASEQKEDTSKSTEKQAEEQPKEEEQSKQPEIFKVGESVKFNDLVITVNSVKDHKGSDFEKPADGNVYKVVDVTVENTGEKEEAISSLMHTSMADSDGYTYNIMIATFVKSQLDGSVPPGRKLRGELAYEVPKAAAGLEFIFSDPFSTGQAIWKVK